MHSIKGELDRMDQKRGIQRIRHEKNATRRLDLHAIDNDVTTSRSDETEKFVGKGRYILWGLIGQIVTWCRSGEQIGETNQEIGLFLIVGQFEQSDGLLNFFGKIVPDGHAIVRCHDNFHNQPPCRPV